VTEACSASFVLRPEYEIEGVDDRGGDRENLEQARRPRLKNPKSEYRNPKQIECQKQRKRPYDLEERTLSLAPDVRRFVS